jgi:hypothetical protein
MGKIMSTSPEAKPATAKPTAKSVRLILASVRLASPETQGNAF